MFPEEPSIGDSQGFNAGVSSPTGGRGSIRNIKAKIPFDLSSVRALNGELSKTQTLINGIKNGLVSMGRSAGNAALNKLFGNIPGITPSGSSGSYIPSPSATQQQVAQRAGQPGPGGVAGASGGGGGGGFFNSRLAGRDPDLGGFKTPGGAIIGNTIIQVGAAAAEATGNRVERGYAYSLAADKLSVMYQQMTGMSRQGVQNAYRYPLMNYRLGGLEGANQIMAFQASTGLNAQASSVDALRTITGFGLGTPDALKMIGGLADPAVVNRMFMTTGQSLFGVGGKENSTISVLQNIVRAAGLNNQRVIETGLRPGSVTRSRLSYMGVPEDMQDLVMQYARENLTYQKKGGTGMYDPSSRAGQALMGINNNFATQVEETQRLKALREEDFYREQADNFAELEKTTQSLTKAFGKFEDFLGGIMGLGISSGGVGQMLGSAGTMIGGALTMGGMPQFGIPLMLGGMFLGGLGGRGDPGPGGNNSTLSNMSVPSYSGQTTYGAMTARSGVSNLQGTFKQRLLKMVQDSKGRVGIGEGVRSQSTQEALFRSRYTPMTAAELRGMSEADRKKLWQWDGKYWKHTSGAQAAPPGRSMHEIGLAADLVGDLDWVVANASKYGLKTFADMGEAWHVQPSELPSSRAEYEKMGAPWGYGPGSPNRDPGTASGPKEMSDHNGGAGNTVSTVATFSANAYGVNEKLQLASAEALSAFVSSQGSSGAGTHTSRTTGAGGLQYVPAQAAGALSAGQLVSLLESQGFSGDNLLKAVGVSWRESGWNPGSIGDSGNSFGLFQINMPLNNRTTTNRLRDYGLSTREQLLDAVTNVRAAHYEVYTKGSWFPWFSAGDGTGWNANGDEEKGWRAPITDKAAAAQVVSAAHSGQSGDPSFPSMYGSGRAGGASTTVVSGGNTFTIAPIININGSGDLSVDIRKIAKEVGHLLENEVRLRMFRSS